MRRYTTAQIGVHVDVVEVLSVDCLVDQLTGVTVSVVTRFGSKSGQFTAHG